MHVYRVFMVGVKDFYTDMKKYFKINSIMNSSERGIKALTRKEMETYQQMPKDMMKVAPVLLISALPFANYVIFPLAWVKFCEIDEIFMFTSVTCTHDTSLHHISGASSRNLSFNSFSSKSELHTTGRFSAFCKRNLKRLHRTRVISRLGITCWDS